MGQKQSKSENFSEKGTNDKPTCKIDSKNPPDKNDVIPQNEEDVVEEKFAHSHLMRSFNHEFKVNHEDGSVEFGKKERNGEIYVGNISSAKPKYVEDHGFTHVIHGEEIEDGKYNKANTSEFTLKNFEDWEKTNLIKWLPKIFSFLDDAFKKNENSKILIHCFAGSSRSSAIACSYIMKVKKTRYEDTVKAMKIDRSCVFPNPGFATQLKLFEAFDFLVSKEVLKKGKKLTKSDRLFALDPEGRKMKEEIEMLLKKKYNENSH